MSETTSAPDPTADVGLADIRAAREVLRGFTALTPVQSSRWLTEVTGCPVNLKCENLQRTGSFKPRGAYLRMSRLSEEQRAGGVVAASAGNHAQGVALAARELGIRARVYMPKGAPIPKENATRGYGAEVVFHGGSVDEALTAAQAYAEESGAVLIHPFDHRDIVAGQGTVGLELLEQVPEVRTVLVPLGGGGLLAGIAIAVKSIDPSIRVVGVQAAGAAAYPRSLAEGRPVALEQMATMADGIKVGRPGEVPFAAVRRYVDEILTVDEEALSRALLALVERAKLVVEPAGAAGVAALMQAPGQFEGPVVTVLSGGNIDPLLLGKVIRHGLAAGGRYVTLQVTISDAAGSLARLLGQIGEAGASVLEVVHARTSPTLPIDAVDVRLQLETRGEAHAEGLVRKLDQQGYDVVRTE
ncbi:threonine ammonia-lyase [Nocardioides insulae]|uniref:threonine ammonia-lyase n=1 Tax=Nocardioides insulae TaxID=394734 RepID=UPI00048FEE75|nr:threonine ammonia-lyase [Nocardioides insulae]